MATPNRDKPKRKKEINSLPKTRNAIDCVGNCVVCKIVREHIGTPVRQLGLKAPKVGRKRYQENKNVSLSVTSSCKKCFKRLSASEVSNTAKHICVSKTTSVRFVTSQLMDTGLQEYVLSSSLKNAETLSAPFVDTVTVKTFGRPRQLNFSASKSGSSTSKVSLGFKELSSIYTTQNPARKIAFFFFLFFLFFRLKTQKKKKKGRKKTQFSLRGFG